MTIDEAIDNLQKTLRDEESVPYEKWVKSTELGIEALREIKDLREDRNEPYIDLLPGETT